MDVKQIDTIMAYYRFVKMDYGGRGVLSLYASFECKHENNKIIANVFHIDEDDIPYEIFVNKIVHGNLDKVYNTKFNRDLDIHIFLKNLGFKR